MHFSLLFWKGDLKDLKLFDLLLIVHWYHPLCDYIIPSANPFFNTQYIQNALNIFVYYVECGENAHESIDIAFDLCYSVRVGG